jgi:hypothetical protein
MIYSVEAWSFPSEEEGGTTEMQMSIETEDEKAAEKWAWCRMLEGFQTRLWLRGGSVVKTSRFHLGMLKK